MTGSLHLQGISSQDIDLDHLEYSDLSIRRHNLFATILLVGPSCDELFEKKMRVNIWLWPPFLSIDMAHAVKLNPNEYVHSQYQSCWWTGKHKHYISHMYVFA